MSDPEASDNSAKYAAIERFLQQHSTALLKFINKKFPGELRRYADPKDIAQDTMFEAFQRLAEFDAERPDAFGWLTTIAKHRMIDALRSGRAKKRGGDRLMVEGNDDVVNLLNELAIYSRTPSISAISREAAVKVAESLRRIQPQYGEALRLRYLEGLSFKESADRMGRSERATIVLCSRALVALRRNLRLVSLVA